MAQTKAINVAHLMWMAASFILAASSVVSGVAGAGGLTLNAVGDGRQGYSVVMCYDGQELARHCNGGEVTLVLESTMHSMPDAFIDWKPSHMQTSSDNKAITLSGELKSVLLGVRAGIVIKYEVVAPYLIRKIITLEHHYGPSFYYRMADVLEPVISPVKYWTWADADNQSGGVVREAYPAIGFETAGGLFVGLLTDNGVNNRWTRAYTQFDMDPAKGLTSIPRIPDEELTSLASAEERKQGKHYVTLKFGELYLHDVMKDGKPTVEAYHLLEYGRKDSKTVYIFADMAKSHRERKILCQTYLAEGMGFEGTTAEKILFADTQMLFWIDEPGSQKAYLVPSLGYQFFYQRDAFWMVSAILDEKVACENWNLVKTTQDESGGVCCHAMPYRWHEGMPGGQTDANIHWIIWAYINKTRYGTAPDTKALAKNLDFIRSTFCKGKPGEYWSLSAGWFDVFDLKGQRVRFAHMQGEFAVALRCAKELGLNVSSSEIESAVEGYRNCYDPNDGYIPFGLAPQFKTMLSPTTLLPEFMSLWLFDKPLLSDEVVVNTLDSIDRVWRKKRAGGYAVPNIIRSDGQFQSRENKTFAESLWWEPGIYHNGGSWLLYEYLSYVAGYHHGWKPKYVGSSALERMSKRLELEFSEELEPDSHEYIPLTKAIDTPGSVWDGSSDSGVPGPPGSKVFGWNAFVIIANEVAGIRQPRDPIIIKNLIRRKNAKECIERSDGKQ